MTPTMPEGTSWTKFAMWLIATVVTSVPALWYFEMLPAAGSRQQAAVEAKEPEPLPPQYLVEADVAALRNAVATMRTDVNTCTAKVAALEKSLAKPEPPAKGAPVTTGSISKKK